MSDAPGSPEAIEDMAEMIRRSGLDGPTLARRTLALLPHLPEEADGEVWRAARAMQSMPLPNDPLVALAYALAEASRPGPDPR